MGSARTTRFLLPLLLLLTVCQVVSALDPGLVARLPPDHVDVRREYEDAVWAPLVELFQIREATRRSRVSGVNVRLTVESSNEHVYLVFVPELDGDYPFNSAGSYILRRRRDNGVINQLKIFLRSDEGYFLRIRPDRDDRSFMSVYLAGSLLQADVPIPLGVETIMTEPLERLLDLTDSFVDWSLFYPDVRAEDYEAVAWMASRVRDALPGLPDAEDGAMDAAGNLVFIESLVLQDEQPGFNCSGFAKWVVDGLYGPLYGSYLSIDEMRQKHPELRGHSWSSPREDDRDPYFGLDWTRNLATAVLSAEEGGPAVHSEAADVRWVENIPYVEDVGYPVRRLAEVLYRLALTEPGYFYLASVNREFGDGPRLNQHVHVAVLFPWFDRTGQFHVDVMERNVETGMESLLQRYENDFVHLVRVRADESFTPPRFVR